MLIKGDDQDNTLEAGSGGAYVKGEGGDDLLIGSKSFDILDGGTGADTLLGGGGGDILSTLRQGVWGSERDPGNSVDGGAGDDYIRAGAQDTVLGGGGNDQVYASTGAGARLDGGAGIDRLALSLVSDEPYVGGTAFLDTRGGFTIDGATVRGFETGGISFGAGDDVVIDDARTRVWALNGGLGNDHLIGNGHDEFLGGDKGENTLEGAGGDDILSAYGNAANLLIGGSGDDNLSVRFGDGQTLIGGAGDDTLDGAGSLDGGKGADTLIPEGFHGFMASTLSGGAGLDTYVFTWVGYSAASAPCTIRDKSIGVVDLSGVDAVSATPGENDTFRLKQAFDGRAGELTVTYSPSDGLTHVEGDVDGDGQADLVILIKGDYSDPSGFVL